MENFNHFTPLPGVKHSIEQMGVGDLHKRICEVLVAARVTGPYNAHQHF